MANYRVRTAVAAVVLAVLASACTSGEARGNPDDDGAPAPAGDERPLVLTTFTVLADMARNVAGDRLRVESITRVGTEIHGYEPTPGDLRRAAGADLVLDNGLGLEAWFEQFLEQAGAPRVTVSDGAYVIPIASGEAVGAANPHAWMSPLEATTYVDAIAGAFAELDPAGAEQYRANADAYADEIYAVQAELMAALDEVPDRQRVLVTCEGAFSYLARDAGLTEVYLWPVNAEAQATPRQVARVIDLVRDNQVPAVFCESTVSDAPMQRVVEATGARFGGVLYVDSLSEPDGPVPTYLDLLRYDVELIVEGLTAGTP